MNYPADIGPVMPVAAWGVCRLAAAYDGPALVLWREDPEAQVVVGLDGDGLDQAATDGLLDGAAGRASIWYDQVGGHDAQQGFAEDPLPKFSRMPQLQDVALNGICGLLFEGGSDPDGTQANRFAIPETIQGQIASADFTIIAVVQPTTTVPRAQALPLEPTDHVLLHLDNLGLPVVRILQRGSFGQEGWWVETKGFAFGPLPAETGAVVVCACSGPEGTLLQVNDRAIETPGRSQSMLAAFSGAIGAPVGTEAGGTSKAYDGALWALLIYPARLSADQRFAVMRSLRGLFDIDQQHTVIMVGDSIAAGFVAPWRIGLEKRLHGLLPRCRFYNCAVPGATITRQAPEAPDYGYTVGLFETTVAPLIGKTPGRTVVLIWGGGNDLGITPPPAPEAVYAGIVEIAAKARDAGADDICVVTVLPRTDLGQSDYQPWRDELNGMIRGGEGYRVIDVAGDAQLGAIPIDPALYPDGTHLSARGFAVGAEIAAPIIAEALGGAVR